MSSRVSVPTTARRIGLAQPPRPFTLAGWSSWPRHRGVHGSRTRSSHALVVAFGICPPQSSLCSGSAFLAVDRTSVIPKDPVAKHAFVGSSSSPASLEIEADLRRGVITRPSCRLRSRGACRIASPLGPYDAFQLTLTRPSRATLQPLADRPGLPPPALLVSRICRPCFRSDRPWAPSLQRFLPARRRRILSDRAVLPAVSHLAVPRLRGFELFRDLHALRRFSTPASGCVHQRKRCSRHRWVAPLLVVAPLRG